MTEPTFNIDSVTVKVQKLLAKANDPAATPQEAETFAAKAQELMDRYRIDIAEAMDAGTIPVMKPEWSTAFVGTSKSEWTNYYYTFVTLAARHTGVRVRVQYVGDGNYEATVLGFSHDVAFFNLLYTSIFEAFTSRLEPKVNTDETDAANALRLRQGGMERNRIAIALGLCDRYADINVQKGANRKVTKLIKDEAKRLGTPHLAEEVLGRSFNAKTYRESYAAGFLDQLRSRLRTLSLANADSGLVLKRTKEEVDEAWYQRYPDERPKPIDPNADPFAAFKPCPKCQKAKSGSCRDHSFRKTKDRPMNWSAVEKGREAARSMGLDATNRRIGG